MTELVDSGWEKRFECFVILKAMLNLPKLENFDIVNTVLPYFFKTNWVASTPIHAPSSDDMHCPDIALLVLPWTCPEPVLNDPGSATHALTQYAISNPNLPALLRICPSMYYLDSLLLADLGTTQSLFMSWLESNSFPPNSWVDSNQCVQKMLESEVESRQFLEKHLSCELILSISRGSYFIVVSLKKTIC